MRHHENELRCFRSRCSGTVPDEDNWLEKHNTAAHRRCETRQSLNLHHHCHHVGRRVCRKVGNLHCCITALLHPHPSSYRTHDRGSQQPQTAHMRRLVTCCQNLSSPHRNSLAISSHQCASTKSQECIGLVPQGCPTAIGMSAVGTTLQNRTESIDHVST